MAGVGRLGACYFHKPASGRRRKQGFFAGSHSPAAQSTWCCKCSLIPSPGAPPPGTVVSLMAPTVCNRWPWQWSAPSKSSHALGKSCQPLVLHLLHRRSVLLSAKSTSRAPQAQKHSRGTNCRILSPPGGRQQRCPAPGHRLPGWQHLQRRRRRSPPRCCLLDRQQRTT
jgi:hypothetical protein